MPMLMPPIIEGILPAFYGNTITVPFQMNRAVGWSEIAGFELKLKTVQNSKYLLQLSTPKDNADEHNLTVTFNISDADKEKLYVGQFYKIQIAYKDAQGIVGHYSSVGTAKYTTKPKVEILNLDSVINNNHDYSYTGKYTQKDVNGNLLDVSEKVYSYRFNLYDSNYNLILTSGEKIHNSINDTNSYESIDNFQINQDLEQDKKYFLQYVVTSTNNMVVASPLYSIVQKTSINPELNFNIIAELTDKEIGGARVRIEAHKDKETGKEKLTTGSFKLLRADSNSNYSKWNEILTFNFFDQIPTRELFIDYTLEQGVSYKYAIVQRSRNGLSSNRLESDTVRADFEHAYLYDGEHQLKIKYNPKISSFKNTILESKIDTIGSQHPFIFRNGNVNYKEFPISGLISLQMDEENLFSLKEFFPKRERPLKKEYRQVEVVNRDFYRFSYIKDSLWIKIQATGKFITLKQYCLINEVKYDEAFERQKNNFYLVNEKGEYEKVIVYNHLCYNFEKDYYRLYTLEGNKYIKVSKTDRFNPGKQYYDSISIPIKENSVKEFGVYSVDNIQAEREFKLKVLEWLNNGKPKLFRSPTEGNYVVRLMSISLQPNDSLGRLLHNFTATAYEIAPFNFETLQSFNIMKNEVLENKILGWETVDIYNRLYKENELADEEIGTVNLINYKAVSLRLEGLVPGEKIRIQYGGSRPAQEIVIGATGAYNLDLSDNVNINGVYLINQHNFPIRHQGIVTYAYYRTTSNSFDTVEEIDIIDVPVRQINGPCGFTIEGYDYNEFLNKFNDGIKHQLQKIHFIQAIQIDPNNRIMEDNNIVFDGNSVNLIETKEFFVKNLDNFNIAFGANVQINICYQISKKTYAIEENMPEQIEYTRALNELSGYIFKRQENYDESEEQGLQEAEKEAYQIFINALQEKIIEQEAIQGEVV